MFTRILKGIYFTMSQAVMVTATKEGFRLYSRDSTIATNANSYVSGIEALEEIKLELMVMESIKLRWNTQKVEEIIPKHLASSLEQMECGYNMNIDHYVHFRDYGYQ